MACNPTILLLPRPRSVSFLQLNCQRSLAVHDDLRARLAALDSPPDVILVQEPYFYSDLPLTICGYAAYSSPPPVSVVTYVRTPCTVLHLAHLSTRSCLVIHASFERFSLHIGNVYTSPDSDLPVFLDHLQRVCLLLPRLLLAGDFNAKSPLWHSRITDPRGRLVLDFLAACSLHSCNAPAPITTYLNPRGEGDNIDLTLCSMPISACLKSWTVAEWSLSDHRAISFDLSFDALPPGDPEPSTVPFCTVGADWRSLSHSLRRRLAGLNLGTPPGELAETFTALVVETVAAALPRRSPRRVQVAWWSPELDDARCRLRRAQVERRLYPAPATAATYRTSRNRYVALLRRSKRDSWRDFITTVGNQNPHGFVSRHALGKTNSSLLLRSISLPDGTATNTHAETVAALLSFFFPKDDPLLDTALHSELRRATGQPSDGPNVPSPTILQLDEIVKNLRPKKAPGLDLITTEILHKIWPVIRAPYHSLLSSVYREGHYPSCWKTARLCLVPKSGLHDPADPKSYRPISLLPTFNKIMEKTLLSHLLDWNSATQVIHPAQFGFLPGRAAPDLLHSMQRTVSESPRKYVACISLDIASAFDRAWWPFILSELRRLHCPKNLFALIQSYLSERRTVLPSVPGTQSVLCERGCPQGSNIGPFLWNIFINPLLSLPFDPGVSVTAYADDIQLLVSADTRLSLELLSVSSLDLISTWADQTKTTFSPRKTVAIMLKGRLLRSPSVSFSGHPVPFRPTVCILGVRIDTGFRFVSHARAVADKARQSFLRLRAVSRAHHGLDFQTLRLLYLTIYLGILAYAASVWYPSLNVRVRQYLLSSQRSALLVILRAYRTASSAALCVAAGLPPVDLLLQQRSSLYLIRRQMHPPLVPSVGEVRASLLEDWQQRWDSGETGRHTHGLLPIVRERLALRWVRPGHRLSQFLLGHGEFGDYLFGRALRDRSSCLDCGYLTDDVWHACTGCPVVLDGWLAVCGAAGLPPELPLYLPMLLRRRRAYEALSRHIEDVLLAREELHRRFFD